MAQIALQHIAEPFDVLHIPGAVQAEFRLNRLNQFGRHIALRLHRSQEIAGRQAHQDKHQHSDPQQQGNQGQQPSDNKRNHGVGAAHSDSWFQVTPPSGVGAIFCQRLR